MGRLDGKVALITGAANGLRGRLTGFGGEAAWLFAREGAKVVMTDIADAVGEASAAQMRADGLDAVYMRHDVASEADWGRVVRATLDRHGTLNVLVNNARGGGGTAYFTPEASLEAFKRTVDVNMTGTFLGVRAAIAPMTAAGGGSVINVSSIYGIVGGPGPAGYFASKGGVRTLTKAAAVQLAPHRIRVNSVHPGYCMTPMNAERFSKPDEAQVRLARVPMGRFGTAEEVAWALVYLASDESSWVTGLELVIDGGMTAA